MNATEIRIGNWLQRLDGSIFQVSAKDILIISEWDSSNGLLPNGIQINKEWFFKFGFEFSSDEWFIDSDKVANQIVIWQWDEGDFGLSYFKTRFQYVHQLQNLYFALTGDELQIKK